MLQDAASNAQIKKNKTCRGVYLLAMIFYKKYFFGKMACILLLNLMNSNCHFTCSINLPCACFIYFDRESGTIGTFIKRVFCLFSLVSLRCPPPITLHKLNNLYTIYQAVTEEKANELIARP